VAQALSSPREREKRGIIYIYIYINLKRPVATHSDNAIKFFFFFFFLCGKFGPRVLRLTRSTATISQKFNLEEAVDNMILEELEVLELLFVVSIHGHARFKSRKC